jgi:tubulin polyglutamylase TTLL5
MDYPPLVLTAKAKSVQLEDKTSWKGLDLSKIGRIGEGINNKTHNDYLIKTTEKFKSFVEDSQLNHNYMTFKNVTEDQLVKTSTPSNLYSKGKFTQSKNLLYKVHKADAKLVRSILESVGFGYTDSHDWNIMWLGCSAKLYLYEDLNVNQRINHFPNSFEITRKDKMCSNLMKMRAKHGMEHFGFFPETYVMPNEYNDFCLKYRHDKETKWIVKPSNSSQGRGIHILESFIGLKTGESCVVSRFIHNPLLINDLKFDLRIYVLVTSFEPLKIYVYDEGLARFASEKYSSFCSSNKFSFLTNYSINKQNEKYIQNENLDHDNIGHKWSLSALIKYLEASSVDGSVLISKIYDLIIKTIITAESTVVGLVRKYNLSRNNCFDLFGFDVLIDSCLKPWLLEVNLSPSLATDSPLDLHIKGNLVSELFNIIGVKNYDRRFDLSRRFKPKSGHSRPQTAKDGDGDEKYNDIFKETVEEFMRIKNFVRIYPTEGSQIYDKFFHAPRRINKALIQFLFLDSIEKTISPLVITGEDLLIEYLARIYAACKINPLREPWEASISSFINHDVWKKIGLRLQSSGTLQKLSELTAELKIRNNNSIKNETSEQKLRIIQKFTSSEIENHLKSTKNELNTIVSCLFLNNTGLLSEIQSQVSQTPKRPHLELNFIVSKNKNIQ